METKPLWVKRVIAGLLLLVLACLVLQVATVYFVHRVSHWQQIGTIQIGGEEPAIFLAEQLALPEDTQQLVVGIQIDNDKRDAYVFAVKVDVYQPNELQNLIEERYAGTYNTPNSLAGFRIDAGDMEGETFRIEIHAEKVPENVKGGFPVYALYYLPLYRSDSTKRTPDNLP